MAFTKVQSQTALTTASGGAANLAATFGASPTVNNLLLCAVCSNTTANANLLTSGSMVGWSLAQAAVDTTGTYLYYKLSDGSETTVTWTPSTTATTVMAIFEYSGNVTSSPLDQAAGHTDNTQTTAASWASGTTGTLAQSDELAVVVFGWNDANNAGTVIVSYTGGYTEQAQVVCTGATQSTTVNVAVATLETAATTAQTSTGTFNSSHTGRRPSGIIATFEAAAVASGPDLNVSRIN